MFLNEVGPELPVQVTALGLVGYFMWWMLRRMERTDTATMKEALAKDSEIAALQTKFDTLQRDNIEQHKQKHDALSRATIAEGQAKLIKRAARNCTCHAMDPVTVFLDD